MFVSSKTHLFIYIFLFAGVFVLSALPVFAQSEGIVQCGRGTGAPCSICDIPPTLNRLMTYVIENIVAPLAVVMVIAGGFMILTAGPSPQRMETGKKILTNTLIGIVIILFSWFIVNTILVVISGKEDGVGGFQGINGFLPWNAINSDCGLGDVASTDGGGIGSGGGAPAGGGTPTGGGSTPPPVFSDPPLSGSGYLEGYDIRTPEAQALANEPPEGSGWSSEESNRLCNATTRQNLRNYQAYIREASQQYGVSAQRIEAIMAAESSVNPAATHRDLDGKSSYGLMQIRPDTARLLDPSLQNLSDSAVASRLQDPRYNVNIGTKYYSKLLRDYGGDKTLASAAYNGGPNANRPSAYCSNTRRWQCLYDNSAHTLLNDRAGHPGYGPTRRYIDNLNSLDGSCTGAV